ncbi:MAG: OmpA family protein [Syntrophus sp. (in: bacteria)]
MSERYEIDNHVDADHYVIDWQPIYCSLIMIMIVFFILLIANSKQDQKEMMTARKSLEEKSSLNGTNRNIRGESGNNIQDGSSILIGASEVLSKAIESKGFTESAGLNTNRRGLRLRMAAQLLFSTGQAALRHDAYPLLSEVAGLVNQHQLGVMIEGHTDENIMQTSLYPSNWELSMARAAQVRQYLIQSGGVPGQHVDAAGFSSYQPLADGDPAASAVNKRVDIYLSTRSDESR